MDQQDINQQIFARMTVQNMLLEQMYAFIFTGMEDKGEKFTAEFLHNLRYKLAVPSDMNPECAIDVQLLQADALHIAERFFSSVRAITGNS